MSDKAKWYKHHTHPIWALEDEDGKYADLWVPNDDPDEIRDGKILIQGGHLFECWGLLKEQFVETPSPLNLTPSPLNLRAN